MQDDRYKNENRLEMNAQALTQDFVDRFKITGYHQNQKRGGQKSVFFPIINNENLVLKLFQAGKDNRFEREMNIYDQFKLLDGIPKIISIDEYNGEAVVFEEFIEGQTLTDCAANYFGNGESIRVLLNNIFQIMKPIWEAEYVHRDIKPDNVIIRPDGRPVLIDFGIARDLGATTITQSGMQPKSWPFASPEQYEGKKDEISYKSDFFSLGAIAYYLHHKSLPFGNTEIEIAQRFKDDKYKPLTLGIDESFCLKEFCLCTLRISVSERPRHIEELIKLL